MIKIKSIFYGFCKVWLPFLLIIFLFFSILFLFDNSLTAEVLELLVGKEKMVNIQELCKYLNTSVSFFLGIILILQLLNFFRKRNSEQVFNSNGNIYYDFSYLTFYIANKILGYTKIQLAGIPISMQYKLILRGTFQKIIEDMWEDHYVEITEGESGEHETPVKVEYKNFNNNQFDKINLLICDTYLIELNSIDKKFVNNPTIIIKTNERETALRYLNKQLVNEVRMVLQNEIPQETKKIYVFSTANPKNNLNIVTSCFRKFGRFQTKKIFVVQYKNKIYKKASRVI
ncbi:hypothetical protein [Enterococcus hirae]|uniref:hypothetical protein n=1 Tax=Enterococcus hirae TaxID=1354 RepID=UPI003846D7A9